MLLGAMPDESAAGLLVPTVKARATDFSIAAIMARASPECLRHVSDDQQEGKLVTKYILILNSSPFYLTILQFLTIF